jgi:drug/metabolite transporter (DMT)-like permease
MTSGVSGTDPRRHQLAGTFAMVVAVLLWGGSAGLAKLLFQRDYSPLIITQTRSTIAFLLFAGWFAWRDRSVFRVARTDLPRIIALGIVGMALTNFTYYFTVSEASVAAAILIQYTAPALVMVYMVLIRKEERGSPIKVGALGLALVGCYLAVKGEGASVELPGWSIVTGPATAVCYAVMIVGSKRLLSRYSQWTMLTYVFGTAAAFWLFIHPPWVVAAEEYSLQDWGVFAAFSLLSTLLPYIFFTHSLRRLEATTVGIVGILEPVVAILAAWWLVGETLTTTQMVGAATILVAVSILQIRGGGAEIPEEHA